MSASKLVVSRQSLRACTNCGAVYSAAVARKCPACGELLGLSTELIGK